MIYNHTQGFQKAQKAQKGQHCRFAGSLPGSFAGGLAGSLAEGFAGTLAGGLAGSLPGSLAGAFAGSSKNMILNHVKFPLSKWYPVGPILRFLGPVYRGVHWGPWREAFGFHC
jgi:hypothetical protein